MTIGNRKFSKPAAYFWLLRPNRSFMDAAVTGSGAFAARAGLVQALWMTLVRWCLAVGGFSLDLYADRSLDIEGSRATIRHNPLVDGSLTPHTGLLFSLAFITTSFFLTLVVAPQAVLFWMLILGIIAGLALHLFETPFGRCLTLGLLQALYLLMGARAGNLSLGLWLLAGMFFFAMFGWRELIDNRDYPQDMVTHVQTLPKRYGVKDTAYFTAVFLVIAFTFSLAVYLTENYTSLIFILTWFLLLWVWSVLGCLPRASALDLPIF